MENVWTTWLPIIISLLSLFGVGTVTKLFWEDRREKKKAKTTEELARVKKEKQDEMREVVSSELRSLKVEVGKISDKMECNTCGTVTLLRDRMKCSLNYCTKQGWASMSDKANWMELYNSYKNLGGNHFREYVDQWKNEMENLPTEDEYNRRKDEK